MRSLLLALATVPLAEVAPAQTSCRHFRQDTPLLKFMDDMGQIGRPCSRRVPYEKGIETERRLK